MARAELGPGRPLCRYRCGDGRGGGARDSDLSCAAVALGESAGIHAGPDQRYIAPLLAPLDRLLRHLVDEGRVRPVPMRTVFFLMAQGGPAPFGLRPLARHVDRADLLAAMALDAHIEAVTRIIIGGCAPGPGALRTACSIIRRGGREPSTTPEEER